MEIKKITKKIADKILDIDAVLDENIPYILHIETLDSTKGNFLYEEVEDKKVLIAHEVYVSKEIMQQLMAEDVQIINEFGEIIPRLLGVKSMAERLGEGWYMKRVSIEHTRNRTPIPSLYIDGRPFWTVQQVDNYKEEMEKRKRK